jgi:diketogulonate reductase-like aldo/keto reductase
MTTQGRLAAQSLFLSFHGATEKWRISSGGIEGADLAYVECRPSKSFRGGEPPPESEIRRDGGATMPAAVNLKPHLDGRSSPIRSSSGASPPIHAIGWERRPIWMVPADVLIYGKGPEDGTARLRWVPDKNMRLRLVFTEYTSSSQSASRSVKDLRQLLSPFSNENNSVTPLANGLLMPRVGFDAAGQYVSKEFRDDISGLANERNLWKTDAGRQDAEFFLLNSVVERAAQATSLAVACGYRLIDLSSTAMTPALEVAVGEIIRLDAQRQVAVQTPSGLEARSPSSPSLPWITARISGVDSSDPLVAFEQTYERGLATLCRLQRGYVELLLLPTGRHNCDGKPCTSAADVLLLAQWRALERLNAEGRALAIGLTDIVQGAPATHYGSEAESKGNVDQILHRVLRSAHVWPHVLQMALDPLHLGALRSPSVRRFLQSVGSTTESSERWAILQVYSVLSRVAKEEHAGAQIKLNDTSPEEKDREAVSIAEAPSPSGGLTMGDHFDYSGVRKELLFAARAVGKGCPYQILIKWCLEIVRGNQTAVIIRSTNRFHLERNLDVFSWTLPSYALPGPILTHPLLIAEEHSATATSGGGNSPTNPQQSSTLGDAQNRLESATSASVLRKSWNRRKGSDRSAAELRDMLLASRQKEMRPDLSEL